VASLPTTGFVNAEELRDKLGNKDFLNLLRSLNIFGIAESLAGLETYKVSGYTSYFKERCNTAKYGRNSWGLAGNTTDDISNCVKEILAIMNDILWTGIRGVNSSHLEICRGFVYNIPQNSRWYCPSFTRE
jgi:hypothetical protein